MVEQTEREKVAKELAQKDGVFWDTLDEVLVNAYLHNADLVIKERNPVPVDDTGKPLFTCSVCEDKAYIDSRPCRECNPVGLPVEEVHPIQMKAALEMAKDKLFNIISTPKIEASAKKEANRELKPGEYICSRCSNIHRENSKIGKKHLKSKAGLPV